MHASAWADVHHIVGETDCILVVLDHDHRVAQVAQVGKGRQQAFVVALVEADGGLVEDVHDPHKAGADLAGQANALGFAAREGVRAAIQGQVIEAYIDQELQAFADFLEDLLGDLAPSAGQAQDAEVISRFTHRQAGDRRQGLVANPDMACLAAQACATAVGAGLGAEELGQLLAHGGRFGFAVAAFEVGDDPFEGVGALDDIPTVIEVAEVDILATAAEEDHFLVFGRKLVEGQFQAEAVMRGQGAEHLEVIDVAPVPAADGTLGQGQLAIDQALGVEELLHAQSVTGGAGASRVVEGEQLGFQLADGVTAMGAGEARGEDDLVAFLVVHGRYQGDAVGQVDGRLEGFRQALLQVAAHLEAVDHHVDGVLLLLIQLGQFIQLVQFAVHAGAHEALGAQFLEHGQVFALALAHHWGQQHQFAAFGQGQYLVDHLADGLGFQRHIVVRAARRADAGIEQAQVVVDLGDGADRGAGVVGGGLLLDGNRRRQAFDGIHIGLFHHRQELPGVGRQRLHIAALAFGVEGVEGQ
ncbi:hypothetical protein FQZ97_314200 [compost metagenome]